MAIQKRAGGNPAAVKSDEMLAAAAVISSPAVKRTVHKLMDGDLQLFQKPTSCFWQCAATVVSVSQRPRFQFRPQHFLYFLPEPQGHGSLRPTFSFAAEDDDVGI